HFKDVAALASDLAGGALPAVSFVINIGYKSEHPGAATKISDGTTATSAILDSIAASPYATSTLVLFTYDEGGGFFDHVAPPPASAVDCQHYGTRVPLIAVGRFARTNFISHVTLEHSSIVKFVEWNWLAAQTGQLGGRDGVVNNLGSLLDPAATGTTVPSN